VVFGKLFNKIKAGLTKTRSAFGQSLWRLVTIGRKIDDAFLDELEETLILSDIGVAATSQILADLREKYRDRVIESQEEIIDFLKNDLRESLGTERRELNLAAKAPTVILIVGVNGVGKTTSIAKLASLLKSEGKSVLLAACDTFRAAATDQLAIWSERAGVDLVRHTPGGDPGAVAYDAVDAALARGIDVLIVDTAGRLHTQTHLMRELDKIVRVIKKKIPDAPHEVLLVLDATTGQNAIAQAQLFGQAVPLTGLFLAKLDGTAKGGIVVAIKKQVNVPVKFIGTGEKMDDVAAFDAASFVDALFSKD
jgi:fused signal recognition particle receptor